MRSACLNLCSSVRSHISKTTHPNFTKSFVHVTSVCRGSVLLLRQCNMLGTSGFVVDVIFSYNGQNRPESKTVQFDRWPHRGQSLPSPTAPCFHRRRHHRHRRHRFVFYVYDFTFFYSYTHSVLFVFFFYFQSPFVPLRSVMQNGNLFHCFVVRQSKPGFMQCMRCYAEKKNILLDLTTNETIGVKGFVKAFRSEFQLSLIQTLTNSSFHL